MSSCRNISNCCPPNNQAPNSSRKLIKDFICIDWTVPPEQVQTIFQASDGDTLLAAGYVRNNSEGGTILVRFFLGNQQVGEPIYVFQASSVAFSYTAFDRVLVNCLGEGTESCNGQLSIVTRTPN